MWGMALLWRCERAAGVNPALRFPCGVVFSVRRQAPYPTVLCDVGFSGRRGRRPLRIYCGVGFLGCRTRVSDMRIPPSPTDSLRRCAWVVCGAAAVRRQAPYPTVLCDVGFSAGASPRPTIPLRCLFVGEGLAPRWGDVTK